MPTTAVQERPAPAVQQALSGRLALSIEEACAATGLSRSYLYEILARRELRSVKKGRRTLVMVSDLLEWLNRP